MDEGNMMKGPIPDSYWVKPNQLLAGEYPRTKDDADSRLKLRRFLEVGINFFLDLTEPGEYGLRPYEALLQAEAAALGQTVEYHRFPIRDLGTPTPAYLNQILDTLDATLAVEKRVYVHCWGGIGRTGTVIGCYLVRHGLSGSEALAQIAHLRHGTPDGWRESPETSAQRHMVQSWHVQP